MKYPQNAQSSLPQFILFLNRPNLQAGDKFYMEILRIPEVLSCLRQYKDILNENEIDIPLWLYGLTHKLKILDSKPKFSVLGFIISLGLFDRWTARHGCPQYIVGSDPVMSVISGEISFEEQALLLSRGRFQDSGRLALYQARSSYLAKEKRDFCLLGLKRRQESSSLKEILLSLKQKIKKEGRELDCIFQFLTPHEREFTDRLQGMDIFPEDFLEEDADLNWLWPAWKRSQIQRPRSGRAKIC